ncbi:MAG: hypothetical protein HQL95_02750 [Magnetococcales bacterium]|nr:hypothetical protein [Magnetococcales bacterium]
MIGMTITTDTPEQLASILGMFNPASLMLRMEMFGPVALNETDPAEEQPAPKKTPSSTPTKTREAVLSREEISALVKGLRDGGADGDANDVASTLVPEVVAQPDTPSPVADKPARKAGRPKKAEESAAPKDSPVEPAAMTVASPADEAPTIDDVRAAMTRVSETVGIMAVKTLLEKFSVKRIGELDPSRYNDFLRAAAEVKA